MEAPVAAAAGNSVPLQVLSSSMLMEGLPSTKRPQWRLQWQQQLAAAGRTAALWAWDAA